MTNDSRLNITLAKGIDPLTKLYTRQSLYQALITLPHARDMHLPTSFVLFNICGLMHYNNLLSFTEGDIILQGMSQLLQQHLPEGALAGRWNGSGFAVILPFSPATLSNPWAAMVAEAASHLKMPPPLPAYIQSLKLDWSCATSPPFPLETLPQQAENQLKQKQWMHNIDLDKIFVPKEELPYAHGMILALLSEKSPYLKEFTTASIFYCQQLGQSLGLSSQELLDLRTAALWQDIGLLNIPLDVLAKPTPITENEHRLILSHVEDSAKWAANFGANPQTIEIIRNHHCRWDGTGFKNRLSGKKIPIAARIIKIINKWTSLQQHLFWQRPFSKEQALQLIAAQANHSYDSNLVNMLAQIAPNLPTPYEINTSFSRENQKSPNLL